MDEYIIELIKILIWPVLFIVILLLFRKPISTFIENWKKAEFKVDKSGITVVAEAVRNITEASIERAVGVEENEKDRYIEEGFKGVSDTITKIQNYFDKIRNRKILWVDDHPEWNINEKSAFETMGIKITWCLTNEESLNKLKNENFDVIISDLFSDEGYPKGFDLLEELKIKKIEIPLIFYTGRVTQNLKEKAEDKGAYGIVDSPASLTSKVLSAIIGSEI